MVWLCRTLLLAVCLIGSVRFAFAMQDASAPAESAHYDFFSGIVAELPEGKITVSRTALGKSENRSFIIGSETKIEGKLKQNVRVTVRFRTSGDGDVAVHIIVRPAPQAPKKS